MNPLFKQLSFTEAGNLQPASSKYYRSDNQICTCRPEKQQGTRLSLLYQILNREQIFLQYPLEGSVRSNQTDSFENQSCEKIYID